MRVGVFALFCVLLGSLPAATAGDPATTEIVPGELSMVTLEHAIDDLPAITFQTSGLSAFGQAELQLTVLRRADEDLASLQVGVGKLYGTILGQAKLGRFVSAGDYTAFGAGSFVLGRSDFTGLLYVPMREFQGMPFRPNTLQVLVLTTGEIEAVREFGPVREIIQLAGQSRSFPWPTWVDRQRLATGGIIGSRLAGLPRARLRHSYIAVDPSIVERDGQYLFGDTLTVTLALAADDRALLAAHRQDLGEVFALLPGVRADVQGFLTVARGSPDMFQVGAEPAASYDVAFLLVAYSKRDPAMTLAEDGVGVVLDRDTAAQFWSAVETGQTQTLDVRGGNRLIVSPRP